MSNEMLFLLIMVASVLISSVSQVMLKASAKRKYESTIKEYLNPLVIGAYALFFASTLVTVYALKYVPLSFSPIVESLGYVFVAVLSVVFFRERIGLRKGIGLGLIVMGMLIVTL